MRIYWVNRKRLWTISAALFSIIFTLLVLVSYYRWSGIEANANKEAIYQGNTGKKVVAICVNVDWGEEYIPAMLEEFKKAQAQVTFFVTGSWAEKNPELLKQMSEAGHSIQNHAYKHVHFSSLSDAEAQAQIKKAEAVIEKIIGKKTRFFAPPYGEQNDRLVKAAGEIGYELIMWSVDTIDWQKPSPQTIVKRAGKGKSNECNLLIAIFMPGSFL